MTQQITLIKDKILSDNYFTLHNITYDLTRKDGEVIRHLCKRVNENNKLE